MQGDSLIIHAIEAECAALDRRWSEQYAAFQAQLADMGARLEALEGNSSRIAALEEYQGELFRLREVLSEVAEEAEAEAAEEAADGDDAGAGDAAEEAADAEVAAAAVDEAIEEVAEVLADAGEAESESGNEAIVPARSHLLTRRIIGRRDAL